MTTQTAWKPGCGGSKEFGEDADKDFFVASDGSGGSNEALKKHETGRF